MDTQKQHILARIRLLLIGPVIAGLVWVGLGLFDDLRGPSRRIAALAHAKQIHLALSEFSIDYDGLFPLAGDDSNSAYRQLFNSDFNDERVFYVPGSAWHDALPVDANGPDQEIGVAPDYAEALTKGENHWAYVNGLNNGSKGKLPVIVDGFSDTVGVFARGSKQKGGIIHEDGVVIIRVDGSGKINSVSEDGSVYERRNGKKVDLFSSEAGIGSAMLRNPL